MVWSMQQKNGPWKQKRGPLNIQRGWSKGEESRLVHPPGIHNSICRIFMAFPKTSSPTSALESKNDSKSQLKNGKNIQLGGSTKYQPTQQIQRSGRYGGSTPWAGPGEWLIWPIFFGFPIEIWMIWHGKPWNTCWKLKSPVIFWENKHVERVFFVARIAPQ